MAIKAVSIKCPECGASLDVEEGRKQIFCEYCGAKILLENENEYIYRHIDEAEVKRAEGEKEIEIKKLELENRKQEADEKANHAKIKIGVCAAIIAALVFVILALFSDNGEEYTSLFMTLLLMVILLAFTVGPEKIKEKKNKASGMIKSPDNLSGFSNLNYVAVEKMLRAAGFYNIECVPLCDLTVGLLKKPGMVQSITIGEENVTVGGQWYAPDSIVVISYHSLAGK